tara:strand:- start:159 stop:452 length:294 start_codon:yes stop_codon:yes gene_type:complete
MVSNFDAFIAGYIETKQVTKIEKIPIIKTDNGSISDGILLKKYISSGNKLILKILLTNDLIVSIFIEKIIPIIIPVIVEMKPIDKPTKKKILVIDEF